jgi:hypothetical protein
MLLQVLRLTQEQISQLPPAERDAILALVSSSREAHNEDRPTFTSDLNSVVLHDKALKVTCVFIHYTQ